MESVEQIDSDIGSLSEWSPSRGSGPRNCSNPSVLSPKSGKTLTPPLFLFPNAPISYHQFCTSKRSGGYHVFSKVSWDWVIRVELELTWSITVVLTLSLRSSHKMKGKALSKQLFRSTCRPNIILHLEHNVMTLPLFTANSRHSGPILMSFTCNSPYNQSRPSPFCIFEQVQNDSIVYIVSTWLEDRP